MSHSPTRPQRRSWSEEAYRIWYGDVRPKLLELDRQDWTPVLALLGFGLAIGLLCIGRGV